MTYRLDEASEIREKDIVGETVVLSKDECHGLIRCTFSAGALKLAQFKGAASILLTTVKDSDVIAVKRQRNYPLFQARFVKCRFHGVFSGIDFGHKDDAEFHENFGAVERCDFTDATLDGCRFFNTDVSTLRFPSVAHAVLPDPHRRVTDAEAFEWPGLLGKYMALKEPESVKAVVLHIPSLARLVQCTEEQVQEALAKFGGLQMLNRPGI